MQFQECSLWATFIARYSIFDPYIKINLMKKEEKKDLDKLIILLEDYYNVELT